MSDRKRNNRGLVWLISPPPIPMGLQPVDAGSLVRETGNFPRHHPGEVVRKLRERIKTNIFLISAPGVCEHVECLYVMFMERYLQEGVVLY